LKLAGEIFHHVHYWADSSSKIKKQARFYLQKTEEKIKKRAQSNFNNSWDWSWSGTNRGQVDWGSAGWGPADSPEKSNKTKRIELDGKIIRFYTNDSLVRETSYILTQSFNWINGFLHTQVKYLDNNESWYIFLLDTDNYKSACIWIQKEPIFGYGSRSYGEYYLLSQKKH
jgi:hypothetical protein